MNPAAKALWFIETNSASPLTLDDIATAAAISPFHLTRVFSLATGQPVMRYLRARRLTQAAHQLAAGAPDILTVALDAGYNSHEAFTRAFRDHFGLTPEAVRSHANTINLNLQEPLHLPQHQPVPLAEPRLEDTPTLLLAGLLEHYTAETSPAIPAQWQRFVPYLGTIPGQLGPDTFGVLCHDDTNNGCTGYLTAVQVSSLSRLPKEFAHLRLAPSRYAVFPHQGHIAAIRQTWFAIWNQWLPASPLQPAESSSFERYTPTFNPLTGIGGIEIWIPILP